MANSNVDFNGIRANKYVYGKQRIVINGHEFYIQCPSKIDEHTTFFMAGRGSGGIGDTSSTFRQARNENVIIIAPVHQKDSDVLTTVDVIGMLAKEYGIEPNAGFSGHSNSGTLALKVAQKYIQTYDKPTTIVLNDPYNCQSDSSINYSLFKDSLIVAYAPISGGCYENFKDRCKKAAVAGAKVLVVRYNSGGHGAADDIAAANKAFELDGFTLKGKCEYIDSYGGTYSTNLSYEYIDEHGAVHRFGSIEEAQAYLDDALLSVSISLYEKCSELKEFAAHYKGKGDTLASNLSYVSNAMSLIKSQIIEHTDINYTPTSSGEAKIIDSFYTASNYYGAVTNVLYGNLAAEADAVYAIANAIYKLDNCGSMIAETTLTDGVKGLFKTSNVSNEIEQLSKVSAELFDTAKNAVTADGRYSALREVLGTTPVAGGVGKISISSLEAAINAIVPNLQNEVDKANGLKSSVAEFMTGIGTSNILQGETWENVKTNMSNYENLLDCNAKAAVFLSDTIKTAMGMVTDYIQGAESKISAVGQTDYGSLATVNELDDSKLPELIAAIEEMTTKIAEQEAFIKEQEAKPDVCDTCSDDGGKTTYECNCRRPYSAADMQGWKETLEKYIEVKGTLDTYKGVLEGFAPVVANAQKIINDAIEQVKNTYENPTVDTQGNQTFNSDFSLNLSDYGIDDSKDYKKLIDDYYEKLNPKTPETTTEADVEDEEDLGGNPGNPGAPGADIGGPPAPVLPTDPTTEAPVETTEIETEVPTMAPTEPRTSVPRTEPETSTPTTTEPTTTGEPTGKEDEPQEEPTKGGNAEKTSTQGGGGGSSSKKPKNPNVDPLTNPNEDSVIDTQGDVVLEEDNTPNDYVENIIEEPVVDEPLTIEPQVEQKDNRSLKAMGIASGIGLAVGGAALGAHTMMKKNEEDETDSSYGYDK